MQKNGSSKNGQVRLDLTAAQRSILEGLFLNQRGDYKKLRKLWKLEDELALSPEQRRDCGWVTNADEELVKVEEQEAELSFTLSLAAAKTLRELALTDTDGWLNSKPLRRMLVLIDEQTKVVDDLD